MLQLTVDRSVTTEPLVLAELHHQAKLAGLQGMPKYPIRSLRLRADIAFHTDQGSVYALVKCKCKATDRDRSTTRLHQRYADTGLPFCYCDGLDDIADTIDWLQHQYQHAGGMLSWQ